MKFQDLKKYVGLFVLGAALIIVYKTFDNFGIILEWFTTVLNLLTPFFIGFGIAYVLFIPCRKIEVLCQKTKLRFLVNYRRGVAVATIYLLFIAAIALILVAIIPALVSSITDFMEHLPSMIHSGVDWFNSLGLYDIKDMSIQKILESDFFSIQKMIDNFDFSNVNKYAKGVMSLGTGLFNVFMGVIISIYILLDRKNLKNVFTRFVRAYVPEKNRSLIGRYVRTVNEFINRYISCQLVDACIVFVLSFFALSMIRVEYAPLLALMVGSFNLIPYFGAITATVLAALITLCTGSFTSAVIVVVVLIVLQQLDANLIQPKLVAGSLQVKPFWVIFGIVLGGGLFGILGIFLAVPIVALLRIILIDILEIQERKKSERNNNMETGK